MKYHVAEDNWFVTGGPRTGKSTLVKRVLLPEAPRFVVLDRKGEYGNQGLTFSSFPEARRYFDNHHEGRMRLVFQNPETTPSIALARYVYHAQKELALPKTVLVYEEAWRFSGGGQGGFKKAPTEIAVDPETGTPVLQRVFTEGNTYGLISLVVTQNPARCPVQMRDTAMKRVGFRSKRLPSDLETEDFNADRLRELEKCPHDRTPIKGTHYLTEPAEMDVRSSWRSDVT